MLNSKKRLAVAGRFLLFSGDVGNRTRVRKISPSNVYERSPLFASPDVSTTDQRAVWLAAETRGSLFHSISGVLERHGCIVTPDPIPAGERNWGTRPCSEGRLLKPLCSGRYFTQRGGEQHRKVHGWHLIVCADFSGLRTNPPRSAPLGSQSGNSLSRRSLSSPGGVIISCLGQALTRTNCLIKNLTL